jgi:hypothetical protein
LMPSAYAVTDLWEKEEQKNGAEFDGRGRDSSYKLVNGEYVVQKYLYDYDPAKPYDDASSLALLRSLNLTQIQSSISCANSRVSEPLSMLFL